MPMTGMYSTGWRGTTDRTGIGRVLELIRSSARTEGNGLPNPGLEGVCQGPMTRRASSFVILDKLA